MEAFVDYLGHIDNAQHRSRMEDLLHWITEKFPVLVPKIAWNQPMFTDHGTYIIGFSISKNHIAVGPERAAINHFSQEISQAGYDHSNELIRIPWDSPIEFSLLEKIIEFNMLDKVGCVTFWRR
jgi:uncharacterized protein YdhG (YjbR/CyaY superfamily)